MGSITKRGLWNTVSLLLPEVLFDLKHGTDTFKLVSNDELSDVKTTSKVFGGPYQAANPKLFFDVFKSLRKDHFADTGFRNEVFIDFGCGKGRTLIMAAELGFRRALGVEYSGQLCETAVKNAGVFKSKSHSDCRIDVVHSDAKEYAIPSDATVFFFFNPFGPAILEPVLAAIRESLKAKPRRAYLIYMNPQHPGVFEVGGFSRVHTWGADHQTPDAILYKGRDS